MEGLFQYSHPLSPFLESPKGTKISARLVPLTCRTHPREVFALPSHFSCWGAQLGTQPLLLLPVASCPQAKPWARNKVSCSQARGALPFPMALGSQNTLIPTQRRGQAPTQGHLVYLKLCLGCHSVCNTNYPAPLLPWHSLKPSGAILPPPHPPARSWAPAPAPGSPAPLPSTKATFGLWGAVSNSQAAFQEVPDSKHAHF